MNATFEPTLLFITENDWNEQQKQDNFLGLLLCHLETMDKYDICKIIWTDELQLNLVEQPNIHPWYQSDLRNPLIAIIHQKFYSRQELIPSHEEECFAEPEFAKIFPMNEINSNFKKLVHSLLEFDEQFYLCVGFENKLIGQFYTFNCQNKNYSPKLINDCADWIKQLDVVTRFYPNNITEEFETKLNNAIEVIRKIEFGNRPILYKYEFTKSFKKDIIKAVNNRASILKSITQKLISTSQEAKQSQLKDEYLEQTKQFRFRVTQRPSSTRIHYDFANGLVQFLNYYDEGEHDDGL
jgi:hypothetical protein